jgi:hypothetical protein
MNQRLWSGTPEQKLWRNEYEKIATASAVRPRNYRSAKRIIQLGEFAAASGKPLESDEGTPNLSSSAAEKMSPLAAVRSDT